MKSNGGQKALYIGLCMLAAVVVWIFADNYGTDGSPITYEKWFRDIPITYTSETVLTGRGLMLLEEGTDATVDLKMQGPDHFGNGTWRCWTATISASLWICQT